LFDVKVRSSVSGGVSMILKSITISVNTFRFDCLFIYGWYLIGAAVQGGWDNNADTNHQPMFRNGTAANKYSFTLAPETLS
jgi:hypothetical protein